MKKSILGRLDRLEKAMGDAMTLRELTLFIRSLAANNGREAAIQPEATGAKLLGQDWTLQRETDETEAEFINRAEQAVPRKNGRPIVILLTYPQDQG